MRLGGAAGRRDQPVGRARPATGVRRRGVRRVATRAVAAAIAPLVLLTACGGSGTTSAPPGSAFTVEDARRALVGVDHLRPLVAFGYDIREQPVLDARQTTLTSLRGPCGAVVDTRFLADGASRVFRSTISLIVEAVAAPGEPVARDLIDRLDADLRPGCPPFDEVIGGATARIQLVGEVVLPEVADQRVAWEQTVTSPDGTVGRRYMVVLRRGGAVVVAAILLTSPLQSPDRLRELAAVLAGAAFGPGAVPPGALPSGTAPEGTLPTAVPGTEPPATPTTTAATSAAPPASPAAHRG